MGLEKVRKEIERLRELIRDADWRYYALSEPEISDKEYDDLLAKLRDLEEKHPQFISPDSPTQRVSGSLKECFPAVRHRVKMLSLDNTYTIEELGEWEEKLKRFLKRPIDIAYFVEPKIDGVSCALTYEKGLLSLGVTRGDGEKGEEITANIKTIRSIPLRLRGSAYPERIEVRGEIYITKDNFKKLNKERAKLKEPPFANPRNAASGSLKLLDPLLVSQRRLHCLVHSFGWAKGYDFKSQNDFLDKAKSWGLSVSPLNKRCRGLKEVIDYCRECEGKRESLNYEVDGAVVKVDSFSLQEELGSTLKSPRWAVAYKFPAHQATTKIKRIDFGVGRTGIITPVAVLEPVECGGVKIARATLHNFEEIERLDVREGDTVLIERAGEVIPKIVKVIASKRKAGAGRVRIPSRCPQCKGEVAKEKEEEVYWYCVNPDCPAQLKRSLTHFSSRGAMDIEGMGESLVDQLVERKVVKGLADIYKLKKEDLLNLPLFKDKKAGNLISSIEESKKRPLSHFLYGLGIRHVGEKAAALLAGRFKRIDRFFALKEADLEKIPEIGPVMAGSVVKFFSSLRIKKTVEEFKKARVNLVQGPKTIKKSKLTGKVFIFTGELEGFSRSGAQQEVEKLGGKWTTSVSKHVDFVVAGKNPGSKYNKARRLGLKILSEKEFRQLTR